MRREEDRDAAPAEVVDQLVDIPGRGRVQAGGRLVEEEYLWVAEQCSGEGDPLAETLRQSGARVVATIGEFHRAQRRIDALFRIRNLVEVGEAAQVLGHGQAEVQIGGLGHDRDPPGDLHSVLRRERHLGHACGTRSRCDHGAKCPHGRCLAGAIGAQETEYLAVADLEGDVFERDAVPEPSFRCRKPDAEISAIAIRARLRGLEPYVQHVARSCCHGAVLLGGFGERPQELPAWHADERCSPD